MRRASCADLQDGGRRRSRSPIASIPRTSSAAACSTCPSTTSRRCAIGSSTTRSSSRSYAPPSPRWPAPRGAQPADRQRDGPRLPRSRAGQRAATRPALPRVAGRPDRGAPRRQHHVRLAVGDRLLDGALRRPGRRLLLLADQQLLFLFVAAAPEEGNFADNRERIARLRAAMARLAGEFPGVRAGVTGGPRHRERRDGHGLRRTAGRDDARLRASRWCSCSSPSGAW